jgi:hypothetical protein
MTSLTKWDDPRRAHLLVRAFIERATGAAGACLFLEQQRKTYAQLETYRL